MYDTYKLEYLTNATQFQTMTGVD